MSGTETPVSHVTTTGITDATTAQEDTSKHCSDDEITSRQDVTNEATTHGFTSKKGSIAEGTTRKVSTTSTIGNAGTYNFTALAILAHNGLYKMISTPMCTSVFRYAWPISSSVV